MDMAPDSEHGPYIDLTLDQDAFAEFQRNARLNFDKAVEKLNCDEAVELYVGLLALSASQAGIGGEALASDGRSIVNDKMDGRETFERYILKEMGNLPLGTEVFVKVTSPRTRRDKFLRRTRISQTYHFGNYSQE